MSFEKELKEIINPESFCVVGNAPNETGKDNGKKIDSFDYVIRFNDYSLDYQNDYGSKVNVWVRATNDLVIETRSQKNNYPHKCIFLRSSNDSNERSRKVWEEKKQKYLILPLQYESKLSRTLHSIPSTGLLFLYVLKENGYSLKENVFGFSFFDRSDLEFGSHHYFEVQAQTSKHNWKNDREYFEKYLRGK